MRALLFVLLTMSCAKSTPPPPPAEDPTTLPLVSGCGCAYQCARVLKKRDGETWEVIHDLQDSATTIAVIERWCFDEKGHGYPEKGAPKEAANCLRVFYDRTPCGGECIPSIQNLRCPK